MGRKATGVRKASDSTIEITFSYMGKRRRERVTLEPTAANLKKAARFREAILEAIYRGTFDYAETFPNSPRAKEFAAPTSVLFGTYIDRWLQQKRPTLKTSTYISYKRSVASIPETLRKIPLENLKRSDFRTWVEGMKCGNPRISNILIPIRGALRDAVVEDYIKFNPLKDWSYKKPGNPGEKRTIDPFSKEERELILQAAKPHHRNIIQFAFWTGLRTSELIALEWTDIDFANDIVHVTKAKTDESKKIETTKTIAGKREVKLLSPAKQALKNQKPLTYFKQDRIFHSDTEVPWTGSKQLRRIAWAPTLEKAGVRYRNQYQTRHTYASMMLSAGEPLAWVSSQLGHSSVMVTAQRYARWIPTDQPNIGEKAVEVFG